jgi:hypothetical protein
MLTRGLRTPELLRGLGSTMAGGEEGRVLADQRLQTSPGVRVALDRLRRLLRR